ncbi:ComEC/Rec2 family competence protein [Pedococcus sp. 5OH_020]|uniref:ComEC/Rec2 family competence protein n=1 Tax=Pedococcus sp. 5OH_020 TaxID=2989814 RepID=UPI0022E9E218|nr:ComEC/Rec2 family competence protein [Pedococcus sp. 5OH_020]
MSHGPDGRSSECQGRASPSSQRAALEVERASTVLDLRLLVPALAAWAFCVVALSWSMRPVVVAAAVFTVLAACLLVRRSPRLERLGTVLALSCAAMGLVGVAVAGDLGVRSTGPVSQLATDHAAVTLDGVVTSDPALRSSGGTQGARVAFSLSVRQVTARGQRFAVHTPVLVMADERFAEVRWRERLRLRGKLVPAQAGEDVVAILRPSGLPVTLGLPGWPARAAERLRAGLRRAAAPLPADARGLVPALVIGDTSRTPPDLTDAMLATGMTHLSAVSGSNVAIVLSFALGGAGLAGLPRRARPLVAMLALAGFVVLARPQPSVLRAATMGAIGLLGLGRSRRGAGIPLLAAAVIMLLVVDPWLSRSYGFALSTLATLGLLLFVRTWGEVISRRLPRRLASWGPALAIPFAAQAMCAPVIVLLQGSVSVVGVLANLLAAPLVAPATISGVAAAVTGPWWPWGAGVLCWVAAVPTLGIAWTARTCATIPGGTLPWPDGAVGAVLLTGVTVGLLLSARWWVQAVRVRPVAAASCCLLVVGVAAPTSAVVWPPAGWRFVACDVGQGDGLVLATTPGHAVLVDAGPDPALISSCLRRLRVTVLDSVVLSHFHADHVDGLIGAINGRTVREVLATPVREPGYQWDEVRRWTTARRIPVVEVQAGDHLVWPGVTADVWWPERRISSGSVPNNGSVVLAVRSGPLDLLLLGDVEREAAHAILLDLRRDPRLRARAGGFDVVKVAHHGSSNLDEDLMRLVAAPVGVVSVGKDNDYGHPSPRTLRVLRDDGYAVLRTDQRGDIAVVTTGDEVTVTWRRR